MQELFDSGGSRPGDDDVGSHLAGRLGRGLRLDRGAPAGAEAALGGGWDASLARRVLLGLAAGANNVLFFAALDRIPLGTVVTIEFVGPLTMALLHAHHRRDVLAAAVVFTGVVLVSGASAAGDSLGIALALGAALGWAGYLLASRAAGAAVNPAATLAVAMAVIAVGVLPVSIAEASAVASSQVLVVVLAVALFGRILPYRIDLPVLPSMPPRVVGLLVSMEPAIAWFVGNRRPRPAALARGPSRRGGRRRRRSDRAARLSLPLA